jgi:hypothetical protein
MTGYILSESEKDQVQGQFYAPYEFFNCVTDINGVWFLFLTPEDEQQVSETEYSWILSLQQGEYVPPPAPPFPPLEN